MLFMNSTIQGTLLNVSVTPTILTTGPGKSSTKLRVSLDIITIHGSSLGSHASAVQIF
jgi:hypothetical protein